MVVPGAFAKSIAERGPGGIRMLFQHDPATPIGTWREIREDSRGLFCLSCAQLRYAAAATILGQQSAHLIGRNGGAGRVHSH